MIVHHLGYRTGSILCAAILAIFSALPIQSWADEPGASTLSKVTAEPSDVRRSAMGRHGWLLDGVPQCLDQLNRLYDAVAAGEVEIAIRKAPKIAAATAATFGPDHPRTKFVRLQTAPIGDLERLDLEQRQTIVSAAQQCRRARTFLSENDREGAKAALLGAVASLDKVSGNRRVLAYSCIIQLATLEMEDAEYSRMGERLDRLLVELTPLQEGAESLTGYLWLLKGYVRLAEDKSAMAEEACRNAIALLKPLAQVEPNGTFARDYSHACHILSILLNDRNDPAGALQFAREALQQQLCFDSESRPHLLRIQIEITRSLSRLQKTVEADLVFMGIIRQLLQIAATREKQHSEHSQILLRCAIAHVEHLRLCGRDELAATQQAAIEAWIQRPMYGIAQARFQEVTRPGFVAQPKTTTGIYPQVVAHFTVEVALKQASQRCMDKMVLGRTGEALTTAREALSQASKTLARDDWSLANLSHFAQTCEDTLRLPEKSQKLVTEAYRLQSLAYKSKNPQDTLVAMRNSLFKIEEAFSPRHPHAIQLRFGLTGLELNSGDLKAAQANLSGLAEPLEHAFGAASPIVAKYWVWSARAELSAREPVIAEQFVRRGLAILEPLIVREGNPTHIEDYIVGKMVLVQIHKARCEWETALDLIRQVSDLQSIINSPFQERAGTSLVVANCLQQLGRMEEATVLLDRTSFSAQAQSRNKNAPCPPKVAIDTYAVYAQHLRLTGQIDEADALQKSLDLAVQKMEKNQTKGELVTPAAGVAPPSASSKR